MGSDTERRTRGQPAVDTDRDDSARKRLEAIERRIAPFVRPRKLGQDEQSVEWSSADDSITGFRIQVERGDLE
jgi:hypothetical protein